MRHRTGIVILGAAALAAAVLPLGVATASTGSNGRTVIPDTAPTGLAARALSTGATTPADGARQLTFQVQLRFRGGSESSALATAVSTPGNGAYGHYLTPHEFDARFAPTAQQAAAVSAYLRGDGIHVLSTMGNRRYIQAAGSIADIERAFGVSMRTYRVGTHTYLTDNHAVSVPSSLASSVLTVTGLNELGGARPGLRSQGSPAAVQPDQDHLNTPCSRTWGAHTTKMPPAYGRRTFPTYICGYSPDQIQAAYGLQGAIATGTNGSGVTVAIIDAYSQPTMQADADRYFAHFNEAGFAPGQYSEILPKSYRLQTACGEPSWQTEEVLDVESVHGIAPGAHVTYVGGRSCSYAGLLGPLNMIVDHHLADIVSNSWGLFGEGSVPTSWLAAYHQVIVQAAAEGIGLYFCDLDSGDLSGTQGSAEPVYPAADPFATGVGGTSLAVSSTGGYEFETGWGNDRSGVAFTDGKPTGYIQPLPGVFYAGTGGGVSTLFRQPSYQRNAVPDSLSRLYGGPRMRVEPDISAVADPYTGYQIGYTDPSTGDWVHTTYGGTSLATPMVAGMIADASTGRSSPVGFVNPLLYAAVGANKSTVNDVVPTRSPVAIAFTSANPASVCYTSCLITEDRDTSLTTAYGYDDVTGLGTPDGTHFLHAIATG